MNKITVLPSSRKSYEQLRQELEHNYFQLKDLPSSRLSQADKEALMYIRHFIHHGGLQECWASVNHNNEVLKRILERSKQRPSWLRRVVIWLNTVQKW